MTQIQPHATFKYVSPDTVAECWDGITMELRKRLWELVQFMTPIPAEIMEDSGPADHIGHDNLADLFHHLTDEEAIALNAAAIKEEEESDAFLTMAAKKMWS